MSAYKQVSQEEQYQIHILKKAEYNQTEIAAINGTRPVDGQLRAWRKQAPWAESGTLPDREFLLTN